MGSGGIRKSLSNRLQAPFPYFGGKSRAAGEVWRRFGNVKNYVEPFAGSAAVLLARPDYDPTKHIETINDADGFVANFWRALAWDPEAVIYWADWPVNEADLRARHAWLVNRKERLLWSLADPDFYDAKIAGWWVWGMCCWIGSEFCSGKGPWVSNGVEFRYAGTKDHQSANGNGIDKRVPFLGNTGRGVQRTSGIRQKRPHLLTGGKGIHRISSIDTESSDTDSTDGAPVREGVEKCLPSLGNGGRGIHRISAIDPELQDTDETDGAPVRDGVKKCRPHIGDGGVGINRLTGGGARNVLMPIARRLARVRVCCGDWKRVCTPSVTTKHGLTGVFLDPPYSFSSGRDNAIYATESGTAALEARKWCEENGSNPLLRIALCGYEGEGHEALEALGWTVYAWKAVGGYSLQANTSARGNAGRERIWFSPHCLPDKAQVPANPSGMLDNAISQETSSND